MQPEPLLISTQAFMRWGGQHAQFLGVVGVMAGGLVLFGTKITQWAGEARNVRIELGNEIELLRNQSEMEAVTRQAELEAARAEAAQQTTERFLLYGYVEDYYKKNRRRRLVKSTTRNEPSLSVTSSIKQALNSGITQLHCIGRHALTSKAMRTVCTKVHNQFASTLRSNKLPKNHVLIVSGTFWQKLAA